ncbi:potassium channel family protein [Nocardia sp. NPDC052566]|uniref:potassium channel family protein n=1 Tax=Nocardia sp. NPDC052566 TaxID=3364330 RepID=UPI0037CB9BCF
MCVWQIRAVLRTAYPAARAIEAAITIFTCYTAGYATVYYILSVTDSHNFSEPMTKLDSLYFCVTIFATVGFGDIAARTEPARAVVLAQMVGNMILIGFALRALTASVRLRRSQLGGPDSAATGRSGS